ncbi:Short-chain dehydrogenase [Myxococcus fulvus]|uniref:Alcohol dehydrogenase n=1 Tax=Myxococcus fulvus TaxID=33 RepID=A0A511SVH6_MYXFU|nr:SDR family oxidoreductase [Myxococcus fulvus]GEN05915.1 alcohol dehydrogenase [Myxococcus fulvus]SET63655.1 Short-chain dehydrogenase [Myxococcus fulvus]
MASHEVDESTRRTVLVTGGSSGIGAEIARVMALQGDRVWFTYHRGHERAQALLQELNDGEDRGHRAMRLDQGDWSQVQKFVRALPGPVDVLINNAAVGTETVRVDGGGSAASEDERFFQVNCLGPLWLTRLLLPGMLERGHGTVVMLSSVDGAFATFPSFRMADGMSKAAVAFMARQLAAELVHAPVTVVCVAPGATDTPMFRASTLDRLDDLAREAFMRRLPKRRLIDAGEVAELVRWVCQPEARVLHGAVLDASLGLGVHPGLMTGRGVDSSGGPGDESHREHPASSVRWEPERLHEGDPR